MNIFPFPRTAELASAPIGVRASQGLRFGVTAAILTLASGISLPAMARAPVATGDAEIARCIRSAAHGKPWLERSLWGLRDPEAGWIGAPVAHSHGTIGTASGRSKVSQSV